MGLKHMQLHPTKSTLDLRLSPTLDDSQTVYSRHMERIIETSAVRLLAVLHALQSSGSRLAGAVLAQAEDITNLGNWLMQSPELRSQCQTLTANYVKDNNVDTISSLLELYASLGLFPGGFRLGAEPLNCIIIDSENWLFCPALSKVFLCPEACALGEFIVNIHKRKVFRESTYDNGTLEDVYSQGIRISVSCGQPSKAGREFILIGAGQLPSVTTVGRIKRVLDDIQCLSPELGVQMSDLMRLYSICRSRAGYRQAGSVSNLPGWAWQDVLENEQWSSEEACHLTVQMVHEFFHTKVNLIERISKLYKTDGQTPLIYSPWKRRVRPLRQVVHAMVTFLAGGAVWSRLIRLSQYAHLTTSAMNYVVSNFKYALQSKEELLRCGILTLDGETLIEACLQNFVAETRSLLPSGFQADLS